MPASEREVWRKLIEEYGLKYPYNDELFYKTHKITRKDFISQMDSATKEE